MMGSSSTSRPATELDERAWTRVRLAGLAAALAAAIVVMLLGERLTRPLSDLFQNLSPAPAASGVQVVVIDGDSLKAVGGWPWSRFYMARLVEEISRRGATAIGLDFLMPEPDRLDPPRFADLYGELPAPAAAAVRALPSMDALFARVIGRSPVVLARAGAAGQSFDAPETAAQLLPPEAQFRPAVPSGVRAFPFAVANLPLLDGAALGHGLVNGDPDDDGVLRRIPLVARVQGAPTPGLALELVRVAKAVDAIDLISDEGRLAAVRVAGRSVPASADGQLALRFSPWRSIRQTPAADLFRKGLPDDLFKGQIVLVGLTAVGSSDVVNTPLGRVNGVFAQAQAVNAILHGQSLRRPFGAAPAEWAIGVALALAAWMAVSRTPMWVVVAVAVVSVAAALMACWLAFQAGLLLDPLPMLAPAGATTAAAVSALFVEGRAVQARLRGQLEEERLQAARVAGELAAAADIQSGMLLPREELAGLTGAVELDAILEPARNVGGDLYDAFMLNPDRLCFLVGDVTGKGVPAALFMALAKSLGRSLLTRQDRDVAAAVAQINAELSQDNRQDMALTLLVGVLDTADGRLELCCAGHENPLVVGPSGPVSELPLLGGPPLCVDPSFPYEAETHRLAPGETLLAFTDGLTEAQAPDGRLWPREALLAAVADAAAAPTARAMVDQLAAAVRAFENGAEPSDDLTILAVRRPPAP
ncbi:MAG TPA: CHASE2 domain-containing protein [Methylomirabilota bacterium]|nr:CHASE2 domain-containing protein [Methylomirabilota bacterium]